MLLSPPAPAAVLTERPAAVRWPALALTLEIPLGILFTLGSVYLHLLQNRAAGGLWRDEANSVQIANLPTLGQTWRYLEFDSYPPLFHLVLRAWNALFASGDASLHALGTLIGLGIVACFWLAARALHVRAPLFALVLLGMNPLMVRYGDSLRGYGLGCALALLTFAAVWRLACADRPDWRRFALAATAAVLGVQCLYHNAPLLLATCLGGAAVALWRRRPAVAAAVLGVGVPAALSLLPYLPTIGRTRAWGAMLKMAVTPAWLWGKFSDVAGSPDPLGVWLWAGLAIGGVLFALWTRRDAAAPRFAAVTLAVGGVVYAGFLVAVGYPTQPWYYLMFLSVAAVCLDVIFGQPDAAPGWRAARLVAAAGFALTTFAQSGALLHERNTDVDLVAARLNADAAPRDLVLVNRWECAVSLGRYYHGAAPLMTIPPFADHVAHRYDLFVLAMAAPDPVRPVYDAVAATLRGGGRVWLVGHPLHLPPGHEPLFLPPVTMQHGGATWFAAYYFGWVIQANAFLKAHAVHAGRVDVRLPAPVSPFENQDLCCYDGWQE